LVRQSICTFLALALGLGVFAATFSISSQVFLPAMRRVSLISSGFSGLSIQEGL